MNALTLMNGTSINILGSDKVKVNGVENHIGYFVTIEYCYYTFKTCEIILDRESHKDTFEDLLMFDVISFELCGMLFAMPCDEEISISRTFNQRVKWFEDRIEIICECLGNSFNNWYLPKEISNQFPFRISDDKQISICDEFSSEREYKKVATIGRKDSVNVLDERGAFKLKKWDVLFGDGTLNKSFAGKINPLAFCSIVRRCDYDYKKYGYGV